MLQKLTDGHNASLVNTIEAMPKADLVAIILWRRYSLFRTHLSYKNIASLLRKKRTHLSCWHQMKMEQFRCLEYENFLMTLNKEQIKDFLIDMLYPASPLSKK